jgi:hypothetical protein
MCEEELGHFDASAVDRIRVETRLSGRRRWRMRTGETRSTIIIGDGMWMESQSLRRCLLLT